MKAKALAKITSDFLIEIDRREFKSKNITRLVREHLQEQHNKIFSEFNDLIEARKISTETGLLNLIKEFDNKFSKYCDEVNQTSLVLYEKELMRKDGFIRALKFTLPDETLITNYYERFPEMIK